MVVSGNNGGTYIAVYIIDSSGNSNTTRELFNDPIFITHLISIDVPDKFYKEHPEITQEEAKELYTYQWCLRNSLKEYPNYPVIIVKDTSVSTTAACDIAEILTHTRHVPDWDVCYLAKWMDKCSHVKSRYTITDKAVEIIVTPSPHGCQALMFSVEGRQKIINKDSLWKKGCLSKNLNTEIISKNLCAIAFSPNLMFSSFSSNQTNNTYSYTADCEECIGGNGSGNGNGNGNGDEVESSSNLWLWFIFFLIFVGIIFILLYFTGFIGSRSVSSC